MAQPNNLEGDRSPAVLARVQQHLEFIYADLLSGVECEELAFKLVAAMRLDIAFSYSKSNQSSARIPSPIGFENHWDQRDAIMICYGDSLLRDGEAPLKTLKDWLDRHARGVLKGVHLLPFYPWSSDDGFAVIDYLQVNETLGSWEDILAIGAKYDLMADLVINHCSGSSEWFRNFLQNKEPGRDYFVTASPEDDLSAVVRPRTSDLLREVASEQGTQHVWCTFSHDQLDLNFQNPEVLLRMVEIIRHYLDNGVRIFRLDAVAFLWKEVGSNCLNLPQTHEVVRLLRTLVSGARSDAMLITETNIPNQENLSYFGNGNEAHCVYNFSLPPLLLNTLVTGNCSYLKQWMMSMPPAQMGTAYFNFVASHDGIGLRPAEGLLTESELATLIETMKSFGGHVSFRALDSGVEKPYEINIALFDALQGTVKGADSYGVARFVCAHAIMLGLEGIPGIYIHSLLGTRNDYERVAESGHFRSINRHQWNVEALNMQLDDDSSSHAQVFSAIMSLLETRQRQSAFHPNATQFTLHLGDQLFGFWRQSMDRRQSIFCISNVSDHTHDLHLADINLIEAQQWTDLISGERCDEPTIVLPPYRTVWISNMLEHRGAA